MEVLGIDVSKDSLVVSWGTRTVVVKNRAREVKAFFRGVPGDSVVGIEATSTYHLLAADHACGLGLTVYVLNPVDAARYRLAFRSRGKTDAIDAELLARMVLKERDQLRPYRPVPPLQRRLKNLLSRRDKMTKARVMLEQSVGGDASLGKLVGQTLKSFAKAVEQMDRQIEELSREIEGFAELSSVPSLGALNVGGLLCALSVGGFRSADAFVAYVGLDCRAKDSGQSTGRRILSKRGSRLLRKNLYMAAMGGCRLPAWAAYYARHLAKGLTRTQALVALARKLARTAWSVYTHRTKFDAARISTQNA